MLEARRFLVYRALSIFLILPACALGSAAADASPVVVAAPPPLANTGVWEARSLRGAPLVAGTTITARFDGERMQGSAGCNQYFTAYRADDWRFRVTEVGTTRMACPRPGVMEQEASFVNALREARFYLLEGNRLMLRDAGGGVLVEFVL